MDTPISTAQTLPTTQVGPLSEQRLSEGRGKEHGDQIGRDQLGNTHAADQHQSRPPFQNVGSTERTLSKVGGAALVLAGLTRGRWNGLLLSLAGGGLLYRGFTGHCYAYQALGIDTADQSPNTVIPSQSGTKVEQSITINRPIHELYSFWREVENLPQIMRHLQSVEAINTKRSRWVAQGPMGITVDWEAEIFNEQEPELIAWRSLPDSQVATAGSIRFKELENDRGTAVTVSLKYDPPGGKVATALAWLLGRDAEQEIEEDLRRFKSKMETGEIPTTEGQPSGRR